MQPSQTTTARSAPLLSRPVNPTKFESNIRKGVIDPVEDAQDAFDRLADTVDDAGKEGTRSLSKFEDELKKVERQSGKVGDAGKSSLKKVGSTGSEVSSELRQNLGETFSSFRGDLEDLPQIAQDTLGGLAGSGALGGIAGLAATAASAAGLGLVVASLKQQQEEAAKLKKRLSSAYQEAAQAGRDYIDEAQVLAELQDLMFNPDRAAEYNRLLDDQKTLGLDLEQLAGAHIGRQEDLRALQTRINALMDDQLVKANESDSVLGGINSTVAGQANRWQKVVDEAENQRQKVEELKEAETRLGENARDQIKRTADASQKRYEALAERTKNPLTVKVRVDDSEVRNYQPPKFHSTLYINRQLTGTAGAGNKSWE